MKTLPVVMYDIALRWRQLDAAAEMPNLSVLSDQQVIFLLRLHREYGPIRCLRLSDLSESDFEGLCEILEAVEGSAS